MSDPLQRPPDSRCLLAQIERNSRTLDPSTAGCAGFMVEGLALIAHRLPPPLKKAFARVAASQSSPMGMSNTALKKLRQVCKEWMLRQRANQDGWEAREMMAMEGIIAAINEQLNPERPLAERLSGFCARLQGIEPSIDDRLAALLRTHFAMLLDPVDC